MTKVTIVLLLLTVGLQYLLDGNKSNGFANARTVLDIEASRKTREDMKTIYDGFVGALGKPAKGGTFLGHGNNVQLSHAKGAVNMNSEYVAERNVYDGTADGLDGGALTISVNNNIQESDSDVQVSMQGRTILTGNSYTKL